MCKRFLLCTVTFLLSGIIFVLCFAGVDASAEGIQYVKQSASSMCAFYGDTLHCNYVLRGTSYSADLNFCGSVSSSGSVGGLSGLWTGCFIDPDNFFSSSYSDYDVIFYFCNVGSGGAFVDDISVYGIDTYYSGYARGAILGEFYDAGTYVGFDENSIALHPNNYFGSNHAVCGNYNMDASLADVYGYCSVYWNNDINIGFRTIPYEFTNGGDIGTVHFDSLRSDNYGNLIIGIVCPFTGGSFSASSPAETTTSPGSSGGQTIINNNVDLTETHSILGGISNFLSDIWEAIRGIPGSILSGIQSIFVPSDEFMEEFEDEIEDIRDRFSWAEDIKEIGARLVDITMNRESVTAPVVVIPSIVNSKNGRVYSESGEKVLDLADYETEVLTVRVILTALLWVFFLWRLYARLPDIIHGAGMIIGDGSKIMYELDERQSQELYNDFDKHDIDKLR